MGVSWDLLELFLCCALYAFHILKQFQSFTSSRREQIKSAQTQLDNMQKQTINDGLK